MDQRQARRQFAQARQDGRRRLQAPREQGADATLRDERRRKVGGADEAHHPKVRGAEGRQRARVLLLRLRFHRRLLWLGLVGVGVGTRVIITLVISWRGGAGSVPLAISARSQLPLRLSGWWGCARAGRADVHGTKVVVVVVVVERTRDDDGRRWAQHGGGRRRRSSIFSDGTASGSSGSSSGDGVGDDDRSSCSDGIGRRSSSSGGGSGGGGRAEDNSSDSSDGTGSTAFSVSSGRAA
jgi:hypothetical protein